MLIEEQESPYIEMPVRIDVRLRTDIETLPNRRVTSVELPGTELAGGLHLFEQIAPSSFAERYPRLMFCAVAGSILLATVTAEIECLRGSGYFWR